MRYTLFTLAIAALFFACGQNNSDKKETTPNEKTARQSDTIAVLKADSFPPKPDSVATQVALSVNPLEASGDQGQITFTQNDKTVFYFRPQTKKGIIRINGSAYKLDKYNYDPNTSSYTLSGGPVKISAMNGKFGEMESDCAYGKFAVVTVTMGNNSVKLNKVEVQDCPNP